MYYPTYITSHIGGERVRFRCSPVPVEPACRRLVGNRFADVTQSPPEFATIRFRCVVIIIIIIHRYIHR